MTSIGDLMDPKLLEQMLAEGFIRVVHHPEEDGLKLYNYTERTQYEKRWNDATEQCRGLIVDADGAVVARPFRKFWNWSEQPGLISDWEQVSVVDKMDGSLGIAYYYVSDSDDELHLAIATRGSFTSDQAKWASSWLRNTYPEWLPTARITPLFEIIYPENRIVLDYGDFAGLVLLGGVNMDTGDILGPHEARVPLSWPGQIAEVLPYTNFGKFRDSEAAQRVNREGVVVRCGNKMIKWKQEDYVILHRLVTGLTNRRVWEAMKEGVALHDLGLPDEFYQWAAQVAGELAGQQATWLEERVQEFEEIMGYRWPPANRREFAEIAKGYPFPGALFKLLDERSIDDMAWAAVRPTEITKPYGGMADV